MRGQDHFPFTVCLTHTVPSAGCAMIILQPPVQRPLCGSPRRP
jgi:hypothetical protein